MEFITEETNFGRKDIFLIDGNVRLKMMFGGNGDLYWIIMDGSKVIKNMLFTVTQENGAVYSAFQDLFADIENINVSTYDDIFSNCYDINKSNQEIRNRIYINDTFHYGELYDRDNKIITWCSDEVSHNEANTLMIRKMDDCFEIEFIPKSIIFGFLNGTTNVGEIMIKFCNSGSYYAPFNVMFMRLFNKLQIADDVKDLKHQFSIEEYIYNKNKRKIFINR